MFESFGVPWSLATPSLPFVAALAERVPPFVLASPGAHPERSYEVVPAADDQRLLARAGARAAIELDDVGSAADWLAGDLQSFLSQQARARVLVHAGAVSWRGKAVLLPGASHSGKSRWVEALLKLGASYLSDDLVALDGEGRVEGFARPLALRREDGSFERRLAGDLGAVVVTAPVPVDAVVIAPYRPQRSRRASTAAAGLAVEPLSPAQCTIALLRHTVAARRRLELARQVLPVVASSAVAARGRRGDANEAASRLLEWLEDEVVGPARHRDPAPNSAISSIPEPGPVGPGPTAGPNA